VPCCIAVGALVKAEERRQQKKRNPIPSTPRNLSIHKDIGNTETFVQTNSKAVPVMSSDGTGEIMMGQF